jgi:isoleucyl-tRNA synthetase
MGALREERSIMLPCGDFDPAADTADSDEHSLDRWMRLQLHELIRDVRGAYDRYEFHRAARMIYEFCTIQASSIYMAAVKDRLYCELPGSDRRRSTQTVLHEVLMALVKLLAPIMPHTCEEAWEHIPHRPAEEPDSVHMALMPDVDHHMLELAESVDREWAASMKWEADTLEPSPIMIWSRLLDLRQKGLLELESLRNAGVKNPMDAEAVFVHRAGDDASDRFLRTYLAELEDLLGVGFARVETAEEMPTDEPIAVRVEDAREKYPRCARSWKRRPDVGSDPEYPDLSARDAKVVKQLR